jgi:hypothetical protein
LIEFSVSTRFTQAVRLPRAAFHFAENFSTSTGPVRILDGFCAAIFRPSDDRIAAMADFSRENRSGQVPLDFFFARAARK